MNKVIYIVEEIWGNYHSVDYAFPKEKDANEYANHLEEQYSLETPSFYTKDLENLYYKLIKVPISDSEIFNQINDSRFNLSKEEFNRLQDYLYAVRMDWKGTFVREIDLVDD